MKYKITLHLPSGDRQVDAEAGALLYTCLAELGDFPLDAPCGGRGKCGKCSVKLRRPGAKVEAVLACKTRVESDLELWPESVELLAEQGGCFALPQPDPAPEGTLGLAFDLGTTTVAASLWDLHGGQRLAGMGQTNAQRRFGADVLSRISFAAEQGQEALTDCLKQQMQEMAAALCAQAGRETAELCRIAAAGNTVMEHFAAGLSAAGLGAAPFTPESHFGCMMELGLFAPVYLAPCPAGYVGGDISAGLLALEADQLEKRFLLIDAGTNGEMVLGGAGGAMRCCATAMGPAFEGAEISCGMAGQPGAINRVALDGAGGLKVTVLGDKSPRGICGAGLIDALALMLHLGALDESGRLLEKAAAPSAARPFLGSADGQTAFFLTPEIYITAGDVRRLQLAKAALRAGVEVLLGDAHELPEQVFLAGGFGRGLCLESAFEIGLLPGSLAGRVQAVGNSALAGAEALLLSQEGRRRAETLAKQMEYLELGGSPAFGEAYVEAMAFDRV